MEEKKARIVIDQREDRQFDGLLQKQKAEVERKQLEVGDFLCSERLVVERKTRSDFEQSIIDQRLFHQLQNMFRNFERVIVIVEGESTEGRISKEALLGAYSSVVSDFGASLFFTRNKEKTAQLIFAIAKHEQLSKKQPMRVFAKRKTLTASANQRAIIEMFPMVGPKLAKALLSHFGNVENVVNASEKELQQVEKMGAKKAKAIRSIIENEYNEEEDQAQMI
jgi:Fanconi anemia group M protein